VLQTNKTNNKQSYPSLPPNPTKKNPKNKKPSQVWWFMPVVKACGRVRQENHLNLSVQDQARKKEPNTKTKQSPKLRERDSLLFK
jgi:hypothetical protein